MSVPFGYYLQDVPLERYPRSFRFSEEDIYETLKSPCVDVVIPLVFDQVKWQIKEAQKL